MRPLLDKLVAGEWQHVFSPVELMCITPPLVMPDRSTYRFTYALRADTCYIRRWRENGDGHASGRAALHRVSLAWPAARPRRPPVSRCSASRLLCR